MPDRTARRTESDRGVVTRWECHCQEPAVLLGTYGADGRVNIKVRDRYWHVIGQIWTVCPKCGGEHSLPLGESALEATVASRRDLARLS